MRREHSKEEEDKLIKFLREHNCIFYSPLSQNDTSDWISGNAMVKYNTNSVVWDSNLNMWKFCYASQPGNDSSYYAKWTLANEIPANTCNHFTVIGEWYQYDTPVTGDVTTSVYDTLPSRSGLALYGIRYTLNKAAWVLDVNNGISNQKHYHDGILKDTYDYTSIVYMSRMTGARIGCPRYSSMRKSFAVKNLASFTDSLTLDEINEYFNIVTV